MGSPTPGNSKHCVSEADLRTELVQTTNKAETPLGHVPKKTSHTRTHTMGKGEREKKFQKQTEERKRQAERLAPH